MKPSIKNKKPSNLPKISAYEQQFKEATRLLMLGQGIASLEIYNNIINEDPLDMRAWTGVGMAMAMTQQWKHAFETLEFVLTRDPHNADALYSLSAVKQAMGDHPGARAAIDAACMAAPDNWMINRFKGYVYATTGASPQEILDIYCAWGRKFADPLTDKAVPFPPLTKAQKDPHRKLRIGYVSGDLRQHSIAFFIEPIFKHHDPKQVDVHVYATSGIEDKYTARMKQHVEKWFNVFDMQHNELFNLIRKHRIDILIDLSGHTAGDRMMVFARKPAPVQLTWMGYMYPLGMKAIQYRFSDYINITPDTKKFYNETPFYINCNGTYHPPQDSEVCLEPPCIKNGYTTFVSLNNSRKVTDEMLLLWGKILEQSPDSRLIILTDEVEQYKATEHMLPRIKAFQLPEDRITVSKRLRLEEFMSLGQFADVQLDTFPISGGTTTFHALWMGLPVVGLQGNDASSSSTETILSIFGFNEWISKDSQGYISKALELSRDIEGLKKQRSTCRQNMLASPIMDYSARTKEIEKAYRLMWFNHLLGKTIYTDANHNLDEIINTYFSTEKIPC